MRLNEDRPIEGAKLDSTTCQETPNTSIFIKYLNMFIEADKFPPGMASFADRNFGPKWFKDPFPGNSPQTSAQSNPIWRAFLTPTLLSYRIEPGSKGFGFMSYQPNLVAHQLGLSQMVLKPLVSHDTDIVWSGWTLTADDHKACLYFCRYTNPYELPFFRFQQSFLTTAYFDDRWKSYYNHAFPNDQFLQNMVGALSTLAGDIHPPPPSVNALDLKLQKPHVNEPPKKVPVHWLRFFFNWCYANLTVFCC